MNVGRHTYGVKHGLIVFKDAAELTIGSFCSFAPQFRIFLGGNHRIDWVTTFPFGHRDPFNDGGEGHPTTNGDVTIGNDVWVGAYASIMSGVTIGDGAVIAANAHVVKDVEPYEIVGGNPARHIRFRFEPDVINVLQRLKWWELPDEEIHKIIPILTAKPDIKKLWELHDRYKHSS
jgi:acetyltransferase-like isoleucine patch superfamily enzyme